MVSSQISGNERWASWKVLLPFESKTRILVAGGDDRLVQSLAKSCKNVNWLSERFPGQSVEPDVHIQGHTGLSSKRITLLSSLDGVTGLYDVIIIAGWKWLTPSFSRKIISLLKPDGVFVQAECNFRPWRRKEIARLGFDKYYFLSALPLTAPRLFFPLFPQEFLNSALSFHVPGSRKARLGIALLKRAARFGFKLPFKQKGVAFYSREKIQGRSGTLSAWLSEKLSLRVDNLAVYCGSDKPRRKITLLVGALGPDGPLSLVAKVADTAAGAEAVKQESSIIRLLTQYDVEFDYPHLLFEGKWLEHTVQVQEALFSGDDFPGVILGDEHFSALASFSSIAKETISISRTSEWQRVEKVMQGEKKTLPPVLLSLWERHLKRVEILGDKIPVHLVHGDFTSWNMHYQKGRLAIFDWEDSLLNGLPFYDLFRFVYRQASLVGPWPGGEVFYSSLMEKIERLCSIAGYDPSIVRKILPLLIINEYFDRPHTHLLDIALFF